jgi:hypothetical protein
MRRFWLASCVLIPLLPGLAMAQSDNTAPPPGAGDDGSGMMGPGPMGGPDGGPGMMGGWGKGGKYGRHGMDPGAFLMAFYAANTTHDGHLTLAQAKAAGMQPVVDHFSDIDVKKRGYVTFYDIAAWRMDDMAQHLEQRANQLRAQDN